MERPRQAPAECVVVNGRGVGKPTGNCHTAKQKVTVKATIRLHQATGANTSAHIAHDPMVVREGRCMAHVSWYSGLRRGKTGTIWAPKQATEPANRVT